VDVIVLGCTHYPFARAAIRAAAGPDARIIESGNAIARRTREVLMQTGLLAGIGSAPTFTIFTTGQPETLAPIVERMLAMRVGVDRLEDAALATVLCSENRSLVDAAYRPAADAGAW
jgi:glutamate racemase